MPKLQKKQPPSQLFYVGERFDLFQKNGCGYKARCPLHDDDKPSLAINEGDDGGILVKCHAGCPTHSILEVVGLRMTDLMPGANVHTPTPHINRATQRVRHEVWNGLDFVVAPMVLTIPGVVNDWLHMLADIRASARYWNNVPMFPDHVDNYLIDGDTESRFELVCSSGLGYVRNARMRGYKLVADGWFGVEWTLNVEPEILFAIEDGEQLGVSIGYSADVKNVTGFDLQTGKPPKLYHGVVSNYTPDHVAVVLDNIGALKIEDGVGVNVL